MNMNEVGGKEMEHSCSFAVPMPHAGTVIERPSCLAIKMISALFYLLQNTVSSFSFVSKMFQN